VPPAQLDKSFGGDCNFEYEHDTFWPEFNRLSGEKRAAYAVRWKAAGSKIGTSEFELKGEDSTSLANAVEAMTADKNQSENPGL
jgi:hypothetical protein